jgi:hypothetical protein
MCYFHIITQCIQVAIVYIEYNLHTGAVPKVSYDATIAIVGS